MKNFAIAIGPLFDMKYGKHRIKDLKQLIKKQV